MTEENERFHTQNSNGSISQVVKQLVQMNLQSGLLIDCFLLLSESQSK